MRRLLILASLALVGCAEAPKGHEAQGQPAASTPPPADANRPATKIPMH